MKFDPIKAIRQQKAAGHSLGCDLSFCVAEKDKPLTVIKSGDKAHIEYHSPREFCYAIGILCARRSKSSFTFSKKFLSSDFGYMADCSRGGVLTVSAVKRLIDILAPSGYSYLELYTEDTYSIEGEPYFGHMRGRYSAREIADIVDYAAVYGIEVVPCIQTMAHLNAMFKWPNYASVCDVQDVLLCESENTYALIEHMIASCRNMFRSDRINIGCD